MKKILAAMLLFPVALFAQNTLQVVVASQNDDVEIRTNNNRADFTSSDLELAGKDGSTLQESYIRFGGVTLPPDAVINHAWLVFYGDETSRTSTVIKISGEIGSSPAWPTSTAASTGENIKARNYTSAFAQWTTDGCVINQEYRTPDLKNVLMEMFPGGINNGNLAFRLQGNEQGAFTVKSYSATAAQRPKLVIDYWSMYGSFSTVVALGPDDAEENLNTGRVNITSPYLELGGKDGSTPQMSAIRFQNVQIPPGAQVTNAYIAFYANGSNNVNAQISIHAEIGNAPAYSTASYNISERRYSALSIQWQTGIWTSNTEQRTPNLRNIIEEIRLLDWEQGNSMAFKLESSSGGARVWSYNGTSTYRAKLVIEYLNNGKGPQPDAVSNPALMDKLYINELSSQGTASDSEDWIELYNGHDMPLYINGGVYLSDKKNNRTLSELSGIFIPAKGFAILTADSDPQAGNTHVGFGLSADGETVYLSRLVEGTVVEQDRLTFGELVYNRTYGKYPDGTGNPATFITPSYKASNAQGKQLLDISFSTERGVYAQNFNLSITAPAGVTVKYTLDGKNPSQTTGTTYTGVVNINKTMVVKAYAYDNAGNNSGVITHTYVLLNNYANESTSASGGHNQWRYKSNITAEEYARAIALAPAVSVSSGSEPTTSWTEASTEYIDNHLYANRSNFFSNSMISRFGQESASYYNPNLKLKFNADAGVKKAEYPFFDQYSGDAYKTPSKTQTIELKEGQDGPSRNVFGLGFMRYSEKISMNLQKEMGKYALDTRFVHLFINGKYRGLKTMRNDFKQQNIEEVFGDSDDNYTKVNLQDADFRYGTVESGEGELSVWTNIRKAATSKNFQQFKRLVDVDDLIKFQIMFMFTDTENEAEAMIHTDPDIMKAKFMISDTDGSFFGGYTSSSPTVSLSARALAGGGGNYKRKWQISLSRNGPGSLFGEFMGSNSNQATGNLEFKTLVKDAVLKYIGPASGNLAGANGAPLSVANVQQKMMETVNELDLLYKLDAAYMGYANNVYQQWKDVDYPRILAQVPERVSFTLQKWLEYNMAHTLLPAEFVSNEEITEGNGIQINNPNNNTKLYYTTNGTDPMGNDGAVSPDAVQYNGQFTLPSGRYTLVTRASATNNWGPKAEKEILVTSSAPLPELMFTGINYKPQTDGDAEFLLITNAEVESIDLTGYKISEGINFNFPAGMTIAAGETVMLAKELPLITGFSQFRKFQWDSGSLSNSGETLTLTNASELLIDRVTYGTSSPWNPSANGQGYYLSLISVDLDNALGENWEALSLVNSFAQIAPLEAVTEDEALDEEIEIYPNPVRDELFINLSGKSVVSVYNIGGQLIERISTEEGRNTLDTSHWDIGIHIVQISGTNGRKIFKIIKK
ncbi:MAG: lamin tail domain-containing protein [Tannerella sp.]|jgi:hypothetical protein|nr:lamin tail domain-containing protein [Tannerella sp.]